MVDQVAEMLRSQPEVLSNIVVEDQEDEPGGQGIGDQKALKEGDPGADQGGQQEARGNHPEVDEDRPVEAHSRV